MNEAVVDRDSNWFAVWTRFASQTPCSFGEREIAGEHAANGLRPKATNKTAPRPPSLFRPRHMLSLTRCRFRLGNNDDARAQSEKAYAILSKFKDAKRTIRIGVLPWGPPGGDRENGPRGGNFITLPGHPFWDLKTVEEASFFILFFFISIPIVGTL